MIPLPSQLIYLIYHSLQSFLPTIKQLRLPLFIKRIPNWIFQIIAQFHCSNIVKLLERLIYRLFIHYNLVSDNSIPIFMLQLALLKILGKTQIKETLGLVFLLIYKKLFILLNKTSCQLSLNIMVFMAQQIVGLNPISSTKNNSFQ